MDFKLNFLGVTVCDFDNSFRFYTETLGMLALDTKPDWALFDTTGMTFELFGGGEHRGGDPAHRHALRRRLARTRARGAR